MPYIARNPAQNTSIKITKAKKASFTMDGYIVATD
jgi:hypothetical protein